mgnify:CR=1 FL=1
MDEATKKLLESVRYQTDMTDLGNTIRDHIAKYEHSEDAPAPE